MAEKKATEKKTTAAKKTTAVKATTTKRATCKKAVEVAVSAENAGFRAGDVYQTLAAAGKAMSVAEIAKAAKITTDEVYLGTGWLLKEGKVKNEDNLVTLA